MIGPDRRWVGAVVLTFALVGLVALAIPDVIPHFFLVVLAVVIGGAAFFYTLFPGSRMFALAFADFLAIYACIFVFFIQTSFGPVSHWARPIGFLLPIVAFLVGAWWRRDEIHRIVTAERVRETRHFGRILQWLIPVFGIGALTFFLPESGFGVGLMNALFLAAMAAIAGIVFAVSQDVTTFLLDTGLLFEDFFGRMSHALVPVFAFFTFYSLNIIVFASIYRIIDRFGAVHHFMIAGHPQEITFPEALYFSVVTLSTVGYGEIVPASNIARVIVAIQIVIGVLLLLFGFSEIIRHMRDRGSGGD